MIQKLDPELRAAICIFYLVLRGLDTIEDDMTIPNEKKVVLLQQFATSIKTPGWNFKENGPNEKDAHLLVDFQIVIQEYLKLAPEYQNAIEDITQRMGNGMSEFLTRKVITERDWDLYCHYVAGLVGIGLSKIFSSSSLESPIVAERDTLSNSMGLFLQKTNIIRDYLEDINQNRIFWPSQVWEKYTPSLKDFKLKRNKNKALDCLNNLINLALEHVPDVIEYMSQLKNQSVFNFCAIPQVMAIATLAVCYNNYNVFTGVVKIRKGEAAKLIIEATSMENLMQVFDRYLQVISSKTDLRNPVQSETRRIIDNIRVKHFSNSVVHSSFSKRFGCGLGYSLLVIGTAYGIFFGVTRYHHNK